MSIKLFTEMRNAQMQIVYSNFLDKRIFDFNANERNLIKLKNLEIFFFQVKISLFVFRFYFQKNFLSIFIIRGKFSILNFPLSIFQKENFVRLQGLELSFFKNLPKHSH